MAVITLDECKAFLQITTTTQDELIELLIPEVQGYIISYCNTDFYNQEDPPAQKWPSGIKLIASMMVGYNLQDLKNGGKKIGVKEETQGDYSYTKFDTGDQEYPYSIIRRLDKYKIARAHMGTIQTQPRDRRGLTIKDQAEDKYFDSIAGLPYANR